MSGTTWTVTRGAENTTPVTHTAGFTVFQVVTAGFLTGVGPWSALTVSPSGDATGVTDAANITAAAASLPVQGGAVWLAPTGRWYIKCGNLTINRSGVYLYAPGVYINAVGTGDVIRMQDTSTYSARTVYGGGILGFPVIDGTSAGAGSAGLHIGDILQLQVEAFVQNFTGAGSIGAHLDNASFWTEQLSGRIYAQSCTSHVVFDVTGANTSTGSFARVDLDVFIDQNTATYDGAVFQNGANPYDGRLGLYGNFTGSGSALTSAAIRLTGQIPAGHPSAGSYSVIQNCRLDVGMECASNTHTPTTMIFGSPGNTKIVDCYGTIDFGAAGNNFAAASGNSSLYTFNGLIRGDSTLAAAAGYPFGFTWNVPGGFAVGNFSGASALSNSSTITTAGKGLARVSEAGNVTGIILAAGSYDGQVVTVLNESNFTVTFAASGTSHVADGTSDVIPALCARQYVYDATDTNLWYRCA